jgi:hypothetical protein
LGDDAVAMSEEIDEYLEHFGAHVDRLPGALHFAALRVEAIVAKDVEHDRSPLDSPGAATGSGPGTSSSPGLHHTRKYQENTRKITGKSQESIKYAAKRRSTVMQQCGWYCM